MYSVSVSVVFLLTTYHPDSIFGTKSELYGDLIHLHHQTRYESTTPTLMMETAYTRNCVFFKYEGWNFNNGNYLFATDTK